LARLTAQDFHPEILKLFDLHVHGLLDRRGFLDKAGKVLVASGAAAGALEALSPNFAAAQQVKTDDARIKTRTVEYSSPEGYQTIKGYLATPVKVFGKLPVVLVVHENRGLNPHIEDIARRLAVEGFIAFAPDGLTPLGGYPGDEDKARELFAKLDQTKSRKDFIAAVDFLEKLPEGNGKVGVVGFCYGGGITNYLATQRPELAAAVPFYGGQPTAEDAARIKTSLLIHYAGADDRINAGWPAYETALKANKIAYEVFIYPGVQHGFNNDTTPRYDEAAAKLAWQRTIDFFKSHLVA